MAAKDEGKEYSAQVVITINPHDQQHCYFDSPAVENGQYVNKNGAGPGCRHFQCTHESFGNHYFCGVFGQRISCSHNSYVERLPECMKAFGTSVPETSYDEIDHLLKIVVSKKTDLKARQEAVQSIQTKYGELNDIIDELIKATEAKFEALREWTKAENWFIEVSEKATRQNTKADWDLFEKAKKNREDYTEKFFEAQRKVSELIAKAKGEKT